jgi:hypothetical protein
MAFCSSCGVANPNDAKFCTGCGASIPSANQRPQSTPPVEASRHAHSTVLKTPENVDSTQRLNELWKFYIVIAICVMVCSAITYSANVFPDSQQFDLTLILAFEAVWYAIAFFCLKYMAINKARPGWALGFLCVNVVLFVWYVTTDDGAFSRVMMIPDVVQHVAGSMLKKISLAVLIIWDEFLGMLIEIVTMYRIFIAVQISKAKLTQTE